MRVSSSPTSGLRVVVRLSWYQPLIHPLCFSVCTFYLILWQEKTLPHLGCRKVSSHFEYLENRTRGLVVTWQAVRGDLTVHP